MGIMAERSANRSELFDEDEIPTADAERPSQRTIDDSGWWRAHFLVVASVLFGAITGLALLGLIRLSSYESPLFRTGANLLGLLIWGLVLIFIGSSLATFYGYYAEAQILERSNADWQPYWWLYVIATPLLSAIVVSLIYLFNRERHVGIQWDQLAIWR